MLNNEVLKSFREELEKVGTKNPVAAYGIKGSVAGAAVGGGTTAIVLSRLLKNIKKIETKSPIVAAATVVGAVAGAKAGGHIGAAMGGAYKGTHNMYDVNYGH